MKKFKNKLPVFLMTIVIISGIIISGLGVYLVSRQKNTRLLELKDEYKQRLTNIQTTIENQIMQKLESVFQQFKKNALNMKVPNRLTLHLKTLLLNNPIVKYPFIITSQHTFLFPPSQKTSRLSNQFQSNEIEQIILKRTVKNLYTEGYNYEYIGNNYFAAIKSYLKSLQQAPGKTSQSYIYSSIARCYFKLKKYPQAIHYYYKILNQETSQNQRDYFLNLTALRQTALAYKHLAEMEKAIKYYLQLYEEIQNHESIEKTNALPLEFLKNEAINFLNRYARRNKTIGGGKQAIANTAIEHIRQTPELDISLQWLYFDMENLIPKDNNDKANKEFKFQRLRELYETNDEKTQFYTAIKNMNRWSIPSVSQMDVSDSVDPTVFNITILKNTFPSNHNSTQIAYQQVQDNSYGQISIYFGYMISFEYIMQEIIIPSAKKHLNNSNLSVQVVSTQPKNITIASIPFQKVLQGDFITLNSQTPNFLETLVRRDIRLYYLLLAALILTLGMGTGLFYKYLSRESELVRLKSEFVDSASHTLKTPLTRISLLAENVKQGWITGQTQKEQFFDTIIAETNRMSEMIDNMLNFSRIEAGKQQIQLEKSYLQEIVATAMEQYTFQLNKEGFQLELEIDDQIPAFMSDIKATKLIVGNILQNAIKYSLSKKYLKVRVHRDGNYAILTIQDHGIGISKKQIPRIFKKYSRGTDPRIKNLEGSGLGLFLVHHALDSLGGHINVKSTPEKGSIFTVFFPIRESIIPLTKKAKTQSES